MPSLRWTSCAAALLLAGRALAAEPSAVANHLAGALRFETVSSSSGTRADPKIFAGLHTYLEKTFPRCHEKLERRRLPSDSLIFTWRGTEPALPPALLLAHQDVVPIEAGTE